MCIVPYIIFLYLLYVGTYGINCMMYTDIHVYNVGIYILCTVWDILSKNSLNIPVHSTGLASISMSQLFAKLTAGQLVPTDVNGMDSILEAAKGSWILYDTCRVRFYKGPMNQWKIVSFQFNIMFISYIFLQKFQAEPIFIFWCRYCINRLHSKLSSHILIIKIWR